MTSAMQGNVWDAAVSAMVAALETVTLPAVTLDPDTGDITVDAAVRTPLKLHCRPVASTAAVFVAGEEERLVMDPTVEEETLAAATLTVVVTEGGEVCHLRQPGGRALTAATLQSCVLAAQQLAATLAGAK